MRKRGAEPCPRVEEGRRKRDLDRGVNLTATRARRVELESDSQVMMRSGLCWTWRMRRASATATREEETVRRRVAGIAGLAVQECGGVLASRAGWIYCTRATEEETAREAKLRCGECSCSGWIGVDDRGHADVHEEPIAELGLAVCVVHVMHWSGETDDGATRGRDHYGGWNLSA